MTRLSDQQVDAIAQQVLARMGARGNAPEARAGALPQAPGEQNETALNRLTLSPRA